MTGSIQTQITHAGRVFRVEVLTVTDANGRSIRRDVVRHPGAVVIVPVAEHDQLVLIRNQRLAVGETLWELPAGTLEPDEEPRTAAARELTEETGFRAEVITALGEFYSSPGIGDELLHVFTAHGLTFVGQALDTHEIIEPVTMPRVEVLEMIADGRVRDGKTIAAVLLWDRARTPEADA